MARKYISENVKTLERYSYKECNGDIAQRVEACKQPGNTIQVKATPVGTSATKIIMPDKSGDFIIKHITASKTVWLGSDDNIAAATGDVFPLNQNDELVVTLKAGEENEIYGIVAADSAVIYVVGVTRE